MILLRIVIDKVLSGPLENLPEEKIIMKAQPTVLICLIVAGFLSCVSGKLPTSEPISDFVVAPLSLGTITSKPIAANDTQFYLFTTDSTGGSYTISLANIGSDVEWSIYAYSPSYVYVSDILDSPVDITYTTVYPAPESGQVSLAANTSYYILVSEWSNIPSHYDLTVTKP